jgi:epoxyqueuosine reductase QueG
VEGEKKMAANPELTQQAKDYALERGVDIVGVASVDRFKGAPDGFHPTDVMKSTRSVITFARKFIMGILDELSPERQRLSYKHHMYAHLNTCNTLTGYDLARFLEERGYKAYIIQPTIPYHAHEFRSVMSHRHAAVLSGLGIFGKSNLVLTKEFGPRQRFCSVLTEAELVPDPCAHHQHWNRADQECKQPCGICIQVCPVGKEAVGISD